MADWTPLRYFARTYFGRFFGASSGAGNDLLASVSASAIVAGSLDGAAFASANLSSDAVVSGVIGSGSPGEAFANLSAGSSLSASLDGVSTQPQQRAGGSGLWRYIPTSWRETWVAPKPPPVRQRSMSAAMSAGASISARISAAAEARATLAAVGVTSVAVTGVVSIKAAIEGGCDLAATATAGLNAAAALRGEGMVSARPFQLLTISVGRGKRMTLAEDEIAMILDLAA